MAEEKDPKKEKEEEEDEDSEGAPKRPNPKNSRFALDPRYWLYADDKILGPYTIRFLRKVKGFHPDILVAPTGSQTGKDWRPAKEFPDLVAMFEARIEAAKPKPKPPEPPKKPERVAAPFPEEPNYLARGLLVVIAVVGLVVLVQYLRGRSKARAEAEPVASAKGAQEEKPPKPEEMWPDPGAPAERIEAEGKLLEDYFPLLLSAQGVKPDQLPVACAAAKTYTAGYAAYQAKFGGPALAAFSQRVILTMRAEKRTPQLDARLDDAGKKGIDLSSLKFAKILKQNMSPADFGLEHIADSARSMSATVCTASEAATGRPTPTTDQP
jgi:hypothetical protein